MTNGLPTACGSSLVGALTHFGLDSIGAVEKDEMRALALRGGPWTQQERSSLLDYCEFDVRALERLLPCIERHLDLPRAVLRGRYMKAVSQIEATGIPIDINRLGALREHWSDVKLRLIQRVDAEGQVYEGSTFKQAKFHAWVQGRNIAWPQLSSGALALDDNTFRLMARQFPEVEPYRQLRTTLSQLRLESLAVGPDARNRCMLSAFACRTGRNAPSNAKFIFGPSAWMRSLIHPQKGWGVVYVDWSQQEFGIAAKLSGDTAMLEAYESGDPYMRFAIQAGSAPDGASKTTHGCVRERFKACALGVLYGMGERSLAARIGQSPAHARALLEDHRRAYPRFWEWSEAAANRAMLLGNLNTVFGWTIHVGSKVNTRSLRNFPMQANGAEMLRLACCLATERGIRVCAPVHDALLVEAPLNDLEATVQRTQDAMAEASEIVLDGFRLRTDAEVFCYPNRFRDERGDGMWALVQDILLEIG